MTDISKVSWRVRGLKAFKLYSCEKKCGNAKMLLFGPSTWRSFSGAVSPVFANNQMKLTAPLGPYTLPFWLVVGGIQIVGLVLMYYGQPSVIIGGLGLAVGEHFFKKWFTKDYTLQLDPSNIASFKRNGPFFEIELRTPPAAGFGKTKFYVSEAYRNTFVSEFNSTFPGIFNWVQILSAPENPCGLAWITLRTI